MSDQEYKIVFNYLAQDKSEQGIAHLLSFARHLDNESDHWEFLLEVIMRALDMAQELNVALKMGDYIWDHEFISFLEVREEYSRVKKWELKFNPRLKERMGMSLGLSELHPEDMKRHLRLKKKLKVKFKALKDRDQWVLKLEDFYVDGYRDLARVLIEKMINECEVFDIREKLQKRSRLLVLRKMIQKAFLYEEMSYLEVILLRYKKLAQNTMIGIFIPYEFTEELMKRIHDKKNKLKLIKIMNALSPWDRYEGFLFDCCYVCYDKKMMNLAVYLIKKMRKKEDQILMLAGLVRAALEQGYSVLEAEALMKKVV